MRRAARQRVRAVLYVAIAAFLAFFFGRCLWVYFTDDDQPRPPAGAPAAVHPGLTPADPSRLLGMTVPAVREALGAAGVDNNLVRAPEVLPVAVTAAELAARPEGEWIVTGLCFGLLPNGKDGSLTLGATPNGRLSSEFMESGGLDIDLILTFSREHRCGEQVRDDGEGTKQWSMGGLYLRDPPERLRLS